MKKFLGKTGLILALAFALGSNGWGQVYNKYGPANGVQKGSTATYQNTAAVAADIYGLWSGTCNATTFLSGAGACGGNTLLLSNLLLQGDGTSSYIRNSTGSGSLFLGIGSTNYWVINPQGGLNNGVVPTSGAAISASTNFANAAMTLFSSGASVNGAYTINFDNNAGVFAYTGVANSALYLGSSAAGTSVNLVTANTVREQINSAGNVTISAPASGTAITVNGATNSQTAAFNSSTTLNQGFGVSIRAGTSSTDTALNIQNAANTTPLMLIYGDGGVTVGGASGGDKGYGAVNALNYFANPTAGPAITANGVTGQPAAIFNGANAAGGVGVTVQGNFTGSGNTNLLTIADQNNNNGVNLQLLGNGVTTPNKTLRVNAGVFEIINSAYNGRALAVSDNGAAVFGLATGSGGAGTVNATGLLVNGGAIPVSNGGTGLATLPAHGVLLGEGASNVGNVAAMNQDTLLQGQGPSVDPAAVGVPNCAAPSALTYSTTTHAFTCSSITSYSTPTSLVGLTAITGANFTSMDSGSAPALSQAIIPTWTGKHTFTVDTSFTGGAAAIGAIHAGTIAVPLSTTTGADQHGFYNVVDGTGVAGNSTQGFLSFNRSTGTSQVNYALEAGNDITSHETTVGVTSSTYSGTFMTGGPAGEMHFLNSSNAGNLCIGVNNIAGVCVGSTGAVKVPAPASGVSLTVAGNGGAANVAVTSGVGSSSYMEFEANGIAVPGINGSYFGQAGAVGALIPGTTLGGTVVRGNGVFISGNAGTSLGMVVGTTNTVTFNSIGTTASAANAFLDSAASNNLLRSTSSRRYKQDIHPLSLAKASEVLNLQPITYRSKAAADDPKKLWFGLIAEDVAAIEPRLVAYDKDGRPDGVQYDRVGVLTLRVVQQQQQQIEMLEAAVVGLFLWCFGLTIRGRRK